MKGCSLITPTSSAPSSACLKFGGFYEAYGWDAILLCQFTGIRAMGCSELGVVQSGVPLANLPISVRMLNEKNISVVRVLLGNCKCGCAIARGIGWADLQMATECAAVCQPAHFFTHAQLEKHQCVESA